MKIVLQPPGRASCRGSPVLPLSPRTGFLVLGFCVGGTARADRAPLRTLVQGVLLFSMLGALARWGCATPPLALPRPAPGLSPALLGGGCGELRCSQPVGRVLWRRSRLSLTSAAHGRYPLEARLLRSQPCFLVAHTQEAAADGRFKPSCPCHARGDLEGVPGSWRRWPSPGCWGHLGSEPAEEKISLLRLSVSLLLCFSDKMKTRLVLPFSHPGPESPTHV